MLRRLWVNAWKAKIPVSFVTPRGLRAWEPNLHTCGGIVIPSVCVIDPLAFVQSLRADSEATGAEFAFNNRVIGIDEDAASYIVTTDRKKIRAACLLNAAGLYADDIASLALHHKKYTIYPLRGEYYEVISPEKKSLIGRLVYPALPREATGKGIHFSPRPNGQLFVGPNEVAVRGKTDYMSQKTPPGMFIETLQKFLPALDERDLRWAYSGIRPCVMTGDRRKSDFIVAVDREDPLDMSATSLASRDALARLVLARFPLLETLKLQSCHFLSAQHPVQRLPKNSLGQFSTELNLLGHFVRCQVASAMREKIIRGDIVHPDNHKRLDRFAPVP